LVLSSGIVGTTIKATARRSRLYHACLWISVSCLAIGIALLLDDPIAHAANIDSSPFLQSFARLMSRLGEGWVVALLGVICPALLLLLAQTSAARVVFLVALIGLLTGATATVLRSVIGRTRPNAHIAQGVYGIRHDSHWIIGKTEFGSFPSGHAATVVGLAAAAWMMNRRLGVAAGAYATLVSWSRIALGYHHFSDIVAATILGVVGAHFLLTRAGVWLKPLGQALQGTWYGGRPGVHPVAGLDQR
jgi:undecaprenyl-diphosphatase